MDETPIERPARAHRAEISSGDDSLEQDSDSGRRLFLGLGAITLVSAALAVILAINLRGKSREERAAVAIAVKQYADIFHEPTSKIYRYSKIQTRRLDGGGWRVSITRVIIPDSVAGYGITSHFKVDRNGTCEYLGQVEELRE